MFQFLEDLKFLEVYIVTHKKLPVFNIIITDSAQAKKLQRCLESQMYSVTYNKFESGKEELVLKFSLYENDIHFQEIRYSKDIESITSLNYYLLVPYHDKQLEKPTAMGHPILQSALVLNSN